MFNVPSLDFPAELALWLEPHVAGTLLRNGIECGSRSCPLKPKPGLNGPPAGFSYGEENQPRLARPRKNNLFDVVNPAQIASQPTARLRVGFLILRRTTR
jgi:hypothetical protein